MSGGRVSIPNNVRKTIHNIKEITGSHSEDEIYAMLKECSMDPNETAQKLLLQDPFHEVKRKRERKKEILNKESTEPRWKPGVQGRGNRGGRVNYSPRNNSNEAGGSKTALSTKENGINQAKENGPGLSMPQGQRDKETVVSSSSHGVPDKMMQSEVTTSATSNKLEGPLPQIPATEASKSPTGGVGSHGPLLSTSASKKTPSSSPSPGVYLSDSDPILMPSQDSRLPVGTIRREVRSEQPPVEQVHEAHLEIKSPAASGSELGNSCMQVKAPSEFQGIGKNHVSFSIPGPSSNYNSRTAMQQTVGPQKVGPSMEWKPKLTNHILGQGTVSNDSIKVPVVPVQVHTPKPDSEDATHELKTKLEELHVSDAQHVIIPNHLHVPEAEKLGFCFGSFDAGFSLNSTSSNGPVSDKSSEVSEVVDERIEEQLRNQIVMSTADEDHPDLPSSSTNVTEKLSPEGDISSNSAPEHHESKQQTSLPSASHQYPIVHTSPNFSFGFIPPMIGTHLASFETHESQGRDGSHVPNFVIQQPIDPASYYAQFYRSGADGDGPMSPFHSTGAANKFSGNVPVLPSQASQSSSQEVGNSLMLSGAGPTPTAATQTGGFMQSSIAVTQQPLPVFRQPTGVHLPHYPPNYIPYAPYFSPFYVPPPAIHQFLSNGTFPQQPQAPQVASPKYPPTQYKTGSNAGNPTHIGIPGNYGPYGSTPAGYNPGSATTAANSNSNEDLGGSQLKESNVYITGQQSEGSGVWMAGPGRDMSGLQANSFYNLPQGGQVAYTPTQATHGTFASIYHPGQPVTTSAIHPLLHQSQTLAGAGVDMVGPTAQINWPNNY